MHSVRSELYMLAAGLFKVPRAGRDQAIHSLAIDILQSEIVEAPWRPALKAIAQVLTEEQQPYRVLTADYVRLFVFPGPHGAAQPFAGHWLQDGGKSALEIEGLMASQGVDASVEMPLAPDHIVAELEVMAHLAQTSSRGMQRFFLCHMANWVPSFSRTLRQVSPLPRFALAANFLDRLIDWDLRQLTAGPPQRIQTTTHADRAST